MNFASDNWAGAHPEINAALASHGEAYATPYGASLIDQAVEKRFSELFERDVAVFFVATGTAANALSMAHVNRPGGVIFAHAQAHMIEDECGAVEYLTGGARLHGVSPKGRLIEPEALDQAIRKFPADFVHHGQPMAVSLTQASETGAVYSLDEIEAIGAVAKAHDLPFHMDGARFANALVSLGTTPAEMTWKRGIDLLSFGGTKNGCWSAEAVVVMDPGKARDLLFLRKRAAQLFSKSRFIAAQFDAYFKDDLWLKSASQANAMARNLASTLSAAPNVRLAFEPQANEVFVILPDETQHKLEQAGAQFYDWNSALLPEGTLGEGEALYRFVTSFATNDRDIEAVRACIAA